jgi:hypothetical protein
MRPIHEEHNLIFCVEEINERIYPLILYDDPAKKSLTELAGD